jgi:hypothetical protein
MCIGPSDGLYCVLNNQNIQYYYYIVHTSTHNPSRVSSCAR